MHDRLVPSGCALRGASSLPISASIGTCHELRMSHEDQGVGVGMHDAAAPAIVDAALRVGRGVTTPALAWVFVS